MMLRTSWRNNRIRASRHGSRVKFRLQDLHIKGGNAQKRQMLRQVLKTHFTTEEIGILKDVEFVLSSHDSRDAGAYTLDFDFVGKGKDKIAILKPPRITLYRNAHDGLEADHVVIIHEVIHHLRVFDPRRNGVEGRTSIDDDKIENELGDGDLEEAMTEAETIARQNPWQERAKSGYYTYLPGDADMLRVQDREEVTESSSVNDPIKGFKAYQQTAKHFPKMNISKLQVAGPAEAIERFYYVNEGKNGFALFKTYDPEGHSALASVKRTFPKAKYIYEIKDGNPVLVQS